MLSSGRTIALFWKLFSQTQKQDIGIREQFVQTQEPSLLRSQYPCSSVSGPLHLRLPSSQLHNCNQNRTPVKLSIRQTGRDKQMDTNTHAVHSLLDNLAGYSSEDGLEDTCVSADFKLDTLEIPSYKAHSCSEYKCYHKCPNVMRHWPHCGFTSVVYSSLLIWCPPPPKLDAQCRVRQITILNMHTY